MPAVTPRGGRGSLPGSTTRGMPRNGELRWARCPRGRCAALPGDGFNPVPVIDVRALFLPLCSAGWGRARARGRSGMRRAGPARAAGLRELASGRGCRRSGKEESGFRPQCRPGASGWLLRKASSLAGVVLDFVKEQPLHVPALRAGFFSFFSPFPVKKTKQESVEVCNPGIGAFRAVSGILFWSKWLNEFWGRAERLCPKLPHSRGRCGTRCAPSSSLASLRPRLVIFSGILVLLSVPMFPVLAAHLSLRD